MKDVHTRGGKEGGFAVSGHPFQFGRCKREEAI